MIDAEDRVLRKHRPRDPVELARRGQVASERLFDDDARLIGQAGGAEPLDDRREQRGRDGEVVRRAPGIAQRLLERLEGVRVVVVAAHVPEQGEEPVEGVAVVDPAGLRDAVRRALAQLLEAPLRGGNTDHRHVEDAALRHRVERRKDLLVREIAGRAEEHQGIGRRLLITCITHPGLPHKDRA